MLTIKTKRGPLGGYIGQLQNGKHWTVSAECERVNKQDALHDAALLRLECVLKNEEEVSRKLYLEAISLNKNLNVFAI